VDFLKGKIMCGVAMLFVSISKRGVTKNVGILLTFFAMRMNYMFHGRTHGRRQNAF